MNRSFSSERDCISPTYDQPQQRSLSNMSISSNNLINESRQNFQVVIRVRPPLKREIDPVYGFSSIVATNPEKTRVTLTEYIGSANNPRDREIDIQQNPALVTYHNYTFDCIYTQDSTQEFVYNNTARTAVESVLEGYNATVIAYGQTGTGKTYTMEGFQYNNTNPQRGIVPRASEDIFNILDSYNPESSTFLVRASYLQIYNEVISDLLKPDRGALQIREEKQRGVFVEGLSEWIVKTPNDICHLIKTGQQTRVTAWTKMNDLSSRSHAVFFVIIEQMNLIQYDNKEFSKEVKVGKLNFVDLAGSERVRLTGATGQRLEESKKINLSLSALGNVIAALTDQRQRSHIPYRDSKLTRLLEDSLGGNCKTTMFAMISPSHQSFGESLSSLKFANRAKYIKNAPTINQDCDNQTLIRKYEKELKKLREQLAAKSLQQVDTMGFKDKQYYQDKLNEIEKDRKQLEEDKQQVYRYKQLLQRQRDIMIALTSRLNERDDMIVQLQEELDAYDQLYRNVEGQLKEKNTRIAYLESLIKENHVAINDGGGDMTPLNNQQQRILDSESKINDLNHIISNQKSQIEKLVGVINGFQSEKEIEMQSQQNGQQYQNLLETTVQPSLMRMQQLLAEGKVTAAQISNGLNTLHKIIQNTLTPETPSTTQSVQIDPRIMNKRQAMQKNRNLN